MKLSMQATPLVALAALFWLACFAHHADTPRDIEPVAVRWA